MSGKGSGRRPLKVDADVFAANWERVFGKGSRPTVPDPLPKDCWGVAEWSKASDTKSDGSARVKSPFPDAGSSPAAPATMEELHKVMDETWKRMFAPTYIDADTGN